jgi:DNA-binding LacI/PurR family transcriptional regulator
VLLTGPRGLRKEVARLLDQSHTEFVLFDEIAVAKVAGRAFVVRSDQAGGTAAMVDHLVSNGHRRIAFIAAMTPWAVIEQRFDAYKRSLRRHGIDVDLDITHFEAGWEPTGAEPMIQALLAHDSPPTAVICGSDLLAIGAIHALRQRGIEVPTQIAVCGFDDFDVSEHMNPQLTTVAVPAWQMGATAAGLLIDALNDKRPTRTDVCLPTTLRRRESA